MKFRAFTQVFALILMLESSFFLIKGSLLVSTEDVATLSKTHLGYSNDVARNLAGQQADTKIGFALLLLGFILQLGNTVWPNEYVDFKITRSAVMLALFVGLVSFAISWKCADYFKTIKYERVMKILETPEASSSATSGQQSGGRNNFILNGKFEKLMQFLTSKNKSLSIDTLRYFFSAHAQSCAAFMGVMGVFAIFRIETNEKTLDRIYGEAGSWLEGSENITGARWLPRVEIKSNLEKFRKLFEERIKSDAEGHMIVNRSSFFKVDGMLRNINAVEQSDAQRHIRPILIFWAILFAGSLIFLAFAEYIFTLPFWPRGLMVVGVLVGTIQALRLSVPYISACLKKAEG